MEGAFSQMYVMVWWFHCYRYESLMLNPQQAAYDNKTVCR